MRQPSRRRPRLIMRDTVMLSGWLFADLLLALSVIFLSANTVGYKPQQIPTPPPSEVVTIVPTQVPTQAPTQVPILELDKHHLQLTIDYNGLLNDSPDAEDSLAQQIRSQHSLQGRNAGLVIVYGNAPDPTQIGTAQNIARKVINVLQRLGQQNFVFMHAKYYDPPLYNLYSNINQTEIDIYLFS